MKENEVHIWRYTLNKEDYYNEKKLPLLSNEEHTRCNKYLREEDQIRYVGNHRFVRQVLANYLNTPPSQIIFSKATMGKPYVKDCGLFFSYSYRGNLGLLSISKQEEVGVDIEKMRPLLDAKTFISFSFSEKEKEIIYNSKPAEFQNTLFTFWTFKEAIIKALGVGLNADLTRVDLSEFFYSESNALSFDKNNLFTLKKIAAVEGYKAAFAIKGKVSNYQEFNYGD